MRRFFAIQAGCYIHDKMPKLMGQIEALALCPIFTVDDDDRQRRPVRAQNSRRESVDFVCHDGQNLDAALFQQLDKIGQRIKSKTPVLSPTPSCPVRFVHIIEYGIGSLSRLVPLDRQAEQFLNAEITLKKMQNLGLDLGLLLGAP